MTLDEFTACVDEKQPLASLDLLTAFEAELGSTLPNDYRRFLIACNGGVFCGRYWFFGPTPEGKEADAGINHIGGLRDDSSFSLLRHREGYQHAGRVRIPRSLMWIMDDPFGNAICVGLVGRYRGQIYFWDHELEPDPGDWNGDVESSGNIMLLANSFTDFITGLKPRPKLVLH